MKKKVAIIFLIFVSVLMFSGCIETNGRTVCKNALDNVYVNEPYNSQGYQVIDYTSDFVSGAEGMYFISFLLTNKTVSVWCHNYEYDVENDRVFYIGWDNQRNDMIEVH